MFAYHLLKKSQPNKGKYTIDVYQSHVSGREVPDESMFWNVLVLGVIIILWKVWLDVPEKNMYDSHKNHWTKKTSSYPRWAPDPVGSRVSYNSSYRGEITPVSHVFLAVYYSGEITPFITIVGARLVGLGKL